VSVPVCIASNSRRARLLESGLTTKTCPSGATAMGLDRVGPASAADARASRREWSGGSQCPHGAASSAERRRSAVGHEPIQETVPRYGGPFRDHGGRERITIPDQLQQRHAEEVEERDPAHVHEDVHGIAGAKDALCHVAPDLLDGGGEERTEVTTCDALQVRAAVHDLSHEELERTQVGRSEAGDASIASARPTGPGSSRKRSWISASPVIARVRTARYTPAFVGK